MKRLTRRAFLNTTGLALGAALAACAPATPTPQPQPTARPAATTLPQATKPAATAVPPATAVPQPTRPVQPVTLTYYSWGDKEKWDSEKHCFEPFLAANPQIKIDFQGYPFAQYWQKILIGMSAGDPPDVFRMNYWKSHAFYARQVIVCLDPYFQKDGFDPVKAFGDPKIQGASVYQGKWYGTPRGNTGNDIVFYNRNVFDKAGIPWPEKTPKWTWNDLLSISRQLTKDTNGDGKTDVWGFDTGKLANDWNGGQALVWGWGGELFSQDGTKCLINTPEAIEGLQFLADLRNKHGVAPYPAQLPEGTGDAFMTGKVAMRADGGYMVNVYKIIKDFDWSIATIPAGPVSQVARCAANATVITKGSKHADVSWQLLKHINAEATVKCEALEGLWPPNTLSAMNADWYLKRNTPPYDLSATVPGKLVEGRAPELHPWADQIRSIMMAEFDPVWAGKKTIREVAPIIERRVNEVLQKKELPELA